MKTKPTTVRCCLNLVLFSILCSIIFTVCYPATAASAKTQSQSKVPKFLSIPVYYLTDRELTGQTYGANRRYHSHCQHHMYYGKTMVNVENKKQLCVDESLSALGWMASDRGQQKIAPKERVDATDPDASKKEFFRRLRTALDKSGKNQLCVFVHGASDPFEGCTQDAAALAYYLKQPIVLYSWPSDPKHRGYFIDGSNSEWSQGHFNTFCKDLESFHGERPIEVTSVSHSMGNRLVIRALPVLYGKGLVKDLELVSPDMDADTCRHYAMDFANTKAKGKLRLYVSSKDKMLPLAQLLAGGYFRLGEAANALEKTPTVHAQLMERIDFTALDRGLTGHTIPFELIANMVQSGTPGEGLDLVSDPGVHPSMLQKFAGRSQGLKAAPSENGLCKRVVRVK